MATPAIQLYFGDLMKNPSVLRCSWGARGVLIWTMAILHGSEEYGSVRWPLEELAQAVGCGLPLIKELVAKGALKGSDKRVPAYRWAPSHGGKRGPEVVLVAEQDGPLWYSSRMVRDEYKRSKRGIGSRFGSPLRLSTATPSGTPSRANGDGKGDGEGSQTDPPSRREGDGASASSSFNEDRSELPPVPREDGKAKGGHKNGSQVQNLATQAWRRDESACLIKAASLGIKPHAGEGWDVLRKRIEAAEAVKQRHPQPS